MCMCTHAKVSENNLCIDTLDMSFHKQVTVDQEIFAVKIIHVLNFRAFNFCRLTVLQ